MFRSSGATKLAEWRERFERFSSCGLAVARFCAQEHVSVASFYHWRKMLGHKGRRRRTTDGHPRHRTGRRWQLQRVRTRPSRLCVLRRYSGSGLGLHPRGRRRPHPDPTRIRRAGSEASIVCERSSFGVSVCAI
jgi:hypothetical protein